MLLPLQAEAVPPETQQDKSEPPIPKGKKETEHLGKLQLAGKDCFRSKEEAFKHYCPVKYVKNKEIRVWNDVALSIVGRTPIRVETSWLGLTCHRVGGSRACGGAGGADHAGVAAAHCADPTCAGTAVAAPLPALSGAAGSQPGAVLPDVVTHLIASHRGRKLYQSHFVLFQTRATWLFPQFIIGDLCDTSSFFLIFIPTL